MKDKDKQRQWSRESMRRKRTRNRAAGIVENSQTDRAAKRWLLVKELGGKCERCGFTPTNDIELRVMDFHHIDPATKTINIASSLTRAWPILLAEIRKCALLCANCHRMIPVLGAGRPRITSI